MTRSDRHIVFDWNGTLFDDAHLMVQANNHLLATEGVGPVTIDFFRDHYDIPFRQLYHNLGLSDEQIQKLIGHENTAFHDHYEPLAARAGLREGAAEILNHAQKHGVRNYILSNHIVAPIRTQLQRLNIDHLFTDVLAYEDRGAQQRRTSTKGQNLHRVRTASGWHSHRTIIVGDSMEEIEIAHEQGLIGVAITGGCVSEERLRSVKPHYVIHSLHELGAIFEKEGFTS